MWSGASNNLASVLNPNNYQLIGANNNIINPVSVQYDAARKSALLGFNSFDAGNYEFKVLQNIKSTAGAELETAYSEKFTTVSNFSNLVDFNFSNARSERTSNTISFDVTITSKADQDLLLPVMLLLDPSTIFDNVTEKIGDNSTTKTITTFKEDGTRVVNNKAFSNFDVKRGEVKEITFKVTDLESDAVSLQLGLERNAGEGIPDYITYKDNGDGTLTLVVAPTFNAFGNNYTFKLVATEVRNDGTPALKNELTFNVNVIAANNAPQISYIGNKVAVVGETNDFIINTSDRDQHALTYSFTGLPEGVANIVPTGVYGQARLTWAPNANDVGKILPVTVTVRDSGNGVTANVLTDTQTFNVVVRNSNAAPILGIINPQTINENSTLNLQLVATDSDRDKLTYGALNLPVGAVFNRETGLLTWTPDYSQAGTYNISVTASDGNRSSTRPFTITVNNINQVPIFTPLGVQYGQENDRVTFKLVADDADGATVEYTAIGTLPQGAILDSRTGDFTWKPNYEQAGEHVLKFQAKDPRSATTMLDVVVSIANVNRAPKLTISDRAVVLGSKLEFKLAGSDLDANTTLKYSAINLPEGATLDGATGQFNWQPNPGQVGNYTVTFRVSDGDLTVTQNALIRVALAPVPPTVTLDLTPSFPAVPGQKVVVQTQAAGLATITSLTAKVAGQVVPIDTFGRFEFTPTAPGKVVVEAIAVDDDGRTSSTSKVVKIRDVSDDATPIVSFAAGLDNAKVQSATNIIGTIADTNLDEWVLSIAEFNSNEFTTIARGTQSLDGVLSQFDPGKYVNGLGAALLKR